MAAWFFVLFAGRRGTMSTSSSSDKSGMAQRDLVVFPRVSRAWRERRWFLGNGGTPRHGGWAWDEKRRQTLAKTSWSWQQRQSASVQKRTRGSPAVFPLVARESTLRHRHPLRLYDILVRTQTDLPTTLLLILSRNLLPRGRRNNRPTIAQLSLEWLWLRFPAYVLIL